ncbi:hypothetical protein AFCDBAGC_3825 [Methylobacterium cerastii]|uniref:Uncharacterized protein n=1 Tax=Methylobacterium cerastii TaxID=932741 RepID=A0ABQ4QLA0_9HYPH|nr:hypothetical protein AFCDBAGC_3825 [Methylobacterium cerastii]
MTRILSSSGSGSGPMPLAVHNQEMWPMSTAVWNAGSG